MRRRVVPLLLLRLTQALLLLVGLYLVLFSAVFLLLRSQAVQDWLVPKLIDRAEEALGARIELDRVVLSPMAYFEFEGFSMYDQQDSLMFAAEQLALHSLDVPTLHWLGKKSRVKTIALGRLHLHRPYAHLYYLPDGRLNIDFLTEPEDSTDTEPPRVALSVDDIQLTDGTFILQDATVGPAWLALVPQQINYENMRWEEISFRGSFSFSAQKDLVVQIRHLSTRDPRTGVQLDNFQATLIAAQSYTWAAERLRQTLPDLPFVQIRDASLSMDETQLRFDLLMKGESLGTLFKRGRNRQYSLFFLPSQLDMRTLYHFIPGEALPIAGTIRLEGPVSGNYRQIKAKGLKLGFGERSTLTADISLRNFLHVRDLFVQARLVQSQLYSQDVHALLPGIALPDEVDRLGYAQITGRFTGFLNDFVADARLTSPHGQLITDANLKFLPGGLSVRGSFQATNLQLDALTGLSVSKRLNARGYAEGYIHNWDDSRLKLRFDMGTSQLLGYQIDSAGGNLSLENQVVTGQLDVVDAEGSFHGRVVADLGKDRPSYRCIGDIEALDLQHYGLLSQPTWVTSIFNIEVGGKEVEDLEGTVRLFEVQLQGAEADQRLEFPDLVLTSHSGLDHRYKYVQLRGYPLDLVLEGQFRYADLGPTLVRLQDELTHLLTNDTASLWQPVAAGTAGEVPELQLDFELRARNLNPVLAFLKTDIRLAADSKLDGSLYAGRKDSLYLHFATAHLQAAGTESRRLETYLNLQKVGVAPSSLRASGQLSADSFSPSAGLTLQHINLAPSWQGGYLHYNLSAVQDTLRNYYLLSGVLRPSPQALDHHFEPAYSRVLVADSIWTFSPQNHLRWEKDRLTVEQFGLTQGGQQIQLATSYIPFLDRTDLSVRVSNLELDLIQHFAQTREPLSGRLSMEVAVRDLLGKPLYSGRGYIERFRYAGITYGNLQTDAYWSEADQRLNVNAELVYESDSVLSVDGYLKPTEPGTPLYLKLSTRNLEVSKASPFVKGLLYDLGGTFSVNNLILSGSLAAPRMHGTGRLRGVTLGIDYLQNKLYLPDEQVRFEGSDIVLDTLRIYNHKATGLYTPTDGYAELSGRIRMQRLANPGLDLRLSNLRNFKVFDLKAHQNSSFYGLAYAKEGWASFTGSFNQVKLSGQISPGKGTHVSIPAYDYTEEQRLSFVRFVQPDATGRAQLGVVQESSFLMDLNLNMTPDATMDLVFDAKSGDVISARGNGSLRLELLPDERFLMSGGYTISEGKYLFTYGNVAAKPFSIEPGGRVSWSGDPYSGQLDLNAVYTVQNANLTAWDTTAGSATVEVLMYLKGSVEQPDLRFGIRMANLSQQQTFRVVSTLNLIRNDAQELNRQVFSLVMMHRVAPVGGLFTAQGDNNNAGAGSIATTSMSQFISSQLTSWIGNGLGDDIDVSFNLTSDGTFSATTTARLFNDKVTVRRDGVLSNTQNRELSLGNFSIEIKLYPGDSVKRENPGQLGVQIFNRENIVTNTLASTSRGAGVYYRKDFNRLAELLGSQEPRKNKIRVGELYKEQEQKVPQPD
ncbi:MAG: translocation/assembly module TamB, partial [Bacteroidetes bacterium]|nr:translocation/assembly module TamB [Bacteroidota bacterium]